MSDRFTIDEAKAADWLARSIAQNESDLYPGEKGYDVDLVENIEAGWTVLDDEDGSDVNNLVYMATGTGIIACPPDVRIDYEYNGAPDPGYRWMVSIDTPRGLQLVSHFDQGWPADRDATDAAACLQILQEAVSIGNSVLDDLDAHKGVPPGSTRLIELLHEYGRAKFGDEWWPACASDFIGYEKGQELQALLEARVAARREVRH